MIPRHTDPSDDYSRHYSPEEALLFKRAMKAALKEWLDEKFAMFGRWSFWTLVALATTSIVFAILTISGWKPPA